MELLWGRNFPIQSTEVIFFTETLNLLRKVILTKNATKTLNLKETLSVDSYLLRLCEAFVFLCLCGKKVLFGKDLILKIFQVIHSILLNFFIKGRGKSGNLFELF